MTERRKARRGRERRHPLRETAKLRPKGPALDRRSVSRVTRERLTVKVSAELIERLRDAVYWTRGTTITGVVQNCIADFVSRMEKEHGDKFPHRAAALRPGRPSKKS